jgi:hypothetical protein
LEQALQLVVPKRLKEPAAQGVHEGERLEAE